MDQANGKVTPIEMEMIIDDYAKNAPFVMKTLDINSKILWHRFTSLKKEGFTETEALEIIKAKGETL